MNTSRQVLRTKYDLYPLYGVEKATSEHSLARPREGAQKGGRVRCERESLIGRARAFESQDSKPVPLQPNSVTDVWVLGRLLHSLSLFFLLGEQSSLKCEPFGGMLEVA